VRRPRVAATVVLTLFMSAGFGGGAANAQIPYDPTAQRKLAIENILVGASVETVDAQRQTCIFGDEPKRVAGARRSGKRSTPDAADVCVAALTRTARAGRLPEFYRILLANLGGDVRRANSLPSTIGATLLGGGDTVDLGNGKTTIIASSVAFDAGFSAAYMKGDKRAAANIDEARLEAVEEQCLAITTGNDGLCYSVGYAEGGRALSANEVRA